MKKYLFMIFTSLVITSAAFTEDIIGKKINSVISPDILPYAASSIDGDTGYSIQGWISYNRFKFRAVAAQVYLPEIFRDNNLEYHRLNVTAFITDYYFSEINRGLWVGSGIEIWENTASDNSEEKQWNNLIMTLGSGYTFMPGKHFYLNPFAAVHFDPSGEKITFNDFSINEKIFQYSASMKLGWMF